MPAAVHDLEIEQGTTYRLAFTWHAESAVTPGQPGDPIDITGAVVRTQIRTTQQGTLLFDGSTTNGKITTDPLLGRIVVTMTPTDTGAMSKAASQYDLEIEMPNTDVYRLLKGSVTVIPNITQTEGEVVVT